MPTPIYSLFHEKSKFEIPKQILSEKEWPEEWKKIQFKTYPNSRVVKLPHPSPPTKSINTILISRRSVRNFQESHYLTLLDLSSLLFYSAGIIQTDQDNSYRRRMYPSAGARFPIEIYAVIFRADGFENGTYHYNVKNHTIEKIAPTEELFKFRDALAYEWSKDATALVIFTATFDRMVNKYGERGYRYVLLEAGHISQNFYLVATALEMGMVALGGIADKVVDTLLELDGLSESVVYGVAIGKEKRLSTE